MPAAEHTGLTTEPLQRPHPRAWAATAVLFFAVLMSYADRGLPALLMEPIKAAFGLSDTEVALLTGFSFAVSISIFAVPLSWIADRYNRALLITVGITVWCVMTLACGFSQGFWSLFLLRMGVGLGEAALAPAAYSLFADLFPARQLSRPLAVMALSSLLGSVTALNGGGLVYELLQRGATVGGFALQPRDAWRGTMVIFGAVGLLVALAAAMYLPEPRRGRAPAAVDSQAGPKGVPLPAYLRASAFFFVPYVAAMCAYVVYSSGFNGWLAPFFQRTYGWSIGLIGQALGTVSLATGLLSAPLGVWLNETVQKRRGREAPVATIWLALIVTVPLIVVMPFAPNGWLAVAGLALILLPHSVATIVAPIVFMTTAPPHLRARLVALQSLCYGLLGSSLGGVVYATFTDRVLGDPAGLPVTLSVVSGVMMLVVIPTLIVADRRYVRAKALAEASG